MCLGAKHKVVRTYTLYDIICILPTNIKMRASPFTSTLLLIALTLAVVRGEGGGEAEGEGSDIDGFSPAQYEDEDDYEEMPYDNMYDNAEDHEMPMTVKFVNEFPDKVSYSDIRTFGRVARRNQPARVLSTTFFFPIPAITSPDRIIPIAPVTIAPCRQYRARRPPSSPKIEKSIDVYWEGWEESDVDGGEPILTRKLEGTVEPRGHSITVDSFYGHGEFPLDEY